MGKNNFTRRKSGNLYLTILGAWVALLAIAAPSLLDAISVARKGGPPVFGLVLVCTLFIAYFWLNGTKDVVYTIWYRAQRYSMLAAAPRIVPTAKSPRVLLLYCTCDDFDGLSLLASMRQNYDNFETVILDDSQRRESKDHIDEFAARYGVAVARRNGRAGFKAGNLNSFLRVAAYDYFVILDSDEVIPPDFISRALDYFQKPGTGIVQANHVARRNENRFMETFAPGVDSHWPAYQSMKQRFGFLSLLGHGAMVSRACYEAAGGFPHVVAEDLAFSIRARARGFFTEFAPDIICEEVYPVNYLAFKKRHSKWTQGNMEFIKRFSLEILKSPLTWFEKLDIVLFTYSLPLTVFFVAYLMINIVALPLLHYQAHYAAWLLVPTAVFIVAPMLNDVLEYGQIRSLPRLLHYCLHCMALYGSMFYTSWRASLTSLFGRSTFIVTPKSGEEIPFGIALRANVQDLVCAGVLLAVSAMLDGSMLPCLLLAGAALASPYLTLLSNHEPTGRELERRTAIAVVQLRSSVAALAA